LIADGDGREAGGNVTIGRRSEEERGAPVKKAKAREGYGEIG